MLRAAPSSFAQTAAGSRVAIEGLNKHYGAVHVLRDIDLVIEPGELFSLLGSSGCGKTTLLRAVAGFVRCETGRILIGGRDMVPLAPYDRPVNMMFQSYALFPHLNVERNIAFGLHRDGIERSEIKRRVGEVLDLIQMTDLRRRMPQQLSGGQKQRVALARAVVKRPKVLLLDEPLSALDRKLRESTRLELVAIQEQIGITFVLVTHDQDEALTMSSRIAVMSDGRIVQVGTPSDIYERPANRFVAGFVGSVNLFDGLVTEVATGMASVDCASLGASLLAPARGFAPGDRVALAVRPERIRLDTSVQMSGPDDRFYGTVIEHAYAGEKRMYRVALQNGAVVQVSLSSGDLGHRPLVRHEPVSIAWDAAASVLVKP